MAVCALYNFITRCNTSGWQPGKIRSSKGGVGSRENSKGILCGFVASPENRHRGVRLLCRPKGFRRASRNPLRKVESTAPVPCLEKTTVHCSLDYGGGVVLRQ